MPIYLLTWISVRVYRNTKNCIMVEFHGYGNNTFGDMNYCPVIFGNMTDRQTDRRKVTHMSPLAQAICTGGLKNWVVVTLKYQLCISI